jgi:hypothetical protein
MYRQLLNNVATVCIADYICCSSETISVFIVYMDIFLEFLSFDCFVDIQQCTIFGVMQHDYTKQILKCCSDVILLFIIQATIAVSLHLSTVSCNFRYGNFHYVWEDNIKLDH